MESRLPSTRLLKATGCSHLAVARRAETFSISFLSEWFDCGWMWTAKRGNSSPGDEARRGVQVTRNFIECRLNIAALDRLSWSSTVGCVDRPRTVRQHSSSKTSPREDKYLDCMCLRVFLYLPVGAEGGASVAKQTTTKTHRDSGENFGTLSEIIRELMAFCVKAEDMSSKSRAPPLPSHTSYQIYSIFRFTSCSSLF